MYRFISATGLWRVLAVFLLATVLSGCVQPTATVDFFERPSMAQHPMTVDVPASVATAPAPSATIVPSPPSATIKVEAPIPPAARATWISYPDVGVDTRIDSYTSSDGVLNPPGGIDDAERIFALEPFSIQFGQGATNTAYLIGHSYDDGRGVFNRIMRTAQPGQQLVVTTEIGRVCYRVDRIEQEDKRAIEQAGLNDTAYNGAAKNRPDWLVFITCYAAQDDPSTVWGSKAAVLYAQINSCGS